MPRSKASSDPLPTLQTELTQLHASLLSPTPTCSRALVQLAQQTPTRLTLPAWHALQLEIASWYLSLVLESTDSSDKEDRVPSEEATRRLTTHHTLLEPEPEPEPAPGPSSTVGIQRPALLPLISSKPAPRYGGLDSEARERAPLLDTAPVDQYTVVLRG